MKYDKEFIKGLIFYIINNSSCNLLNFTKLNTILLYADVLYYGYRKTTLTQSIYIKQNNYCFLKEIIELLNELHKENQILITRLDDDSPVIFYSTSINFGCISPKYNIKCPTSFINTPLNNTSQNYLFNADLIKLLDKSINTVLCFSDDDISIFTNALYNKGYSFISLTSKIDYESNVEFINLLDKLNIISPYNLHKG